MSKWNRWGLSLSCPRDPREIILQGILIYLRTLAGPHEPTLVDLLGLINSI